MSGQTVVTPPALEPVTLAEARAHVRVDGGTEDAILAGYLIAARMHVEQMTGRLLMTQTIDYRLDGWPLEWDRMCQAHVLKIRIPGPVQSITSISYVDTSGVTQTLDTADYQLVKAETPYIVPAYGESWPDARLQPDAVTVRAVVGYGNNPGDTPEPIRLAILLLVASFYENRENSAPAAAAPHVAGVDALISRYKIDGLI